MNKHVIFLYDSEVTLARTMVRDLAPDDEQEYADQPMVLDGHHLKLHSQHEVSRALSYLERYVADEVGGRWLDVAVRVARKIRDQCRC